MERRMLVLSQLDYAKRTAGLFAELNESADLRAELVRDPARVISSRLHGSSEYLRAEYKRLGSRPHFLFVRAVPRL
jgi:hypothetical protein